MNAERYPSDLIITVDDFAACGWREALKGISREGYSSMWQAFSDAARKALDDGRTAHSKVLWLLADACSMRLVPKSFNEPFKPFMVMEDRRSVVPDDLPDADLVFFSAIIDSVDEPWLKARLADLVWLKQRPRDVKFAIAAIDAYRQIPLDTETWVRGGRECWERAVSLALWLRSQEQQTALESAVLAAFETATTEHGFLGFWLAELLLVNRLGVDHWESVAQKLGALAQEFKDSGDIYRAREYFRISGEYFNRLKDRARAAKMIAAVAETWVDEAVARTSSDQPSHIVATNFYENAIQVYRSIPRSERSNFRVDARIAELRIHLTESGEKSLGEMVRISSPPQDLSELIENARNAVTGKKPQDAMRAFANLCPGANAESLRKNSIKHFQTFIFSALGSRTLMSPDGRVIAKRPAMSLSSAPTADDEITIRAQMIDDYKIWISIVVQGEIMPAHRELLTEHRLREDDFIALAIESPIVPVEKKRLFGKALFAGYDCDFETALHLLVPQIEAMVRFHLKQAGATTTVIDKTGIENVLGLSTLMEQPEVEQVFGPDLAFEIRALFCDAFGPNLRNELAHGLLDDGDGNSIYSVYAWWLALRLVFNAFLYRLQRNNGVDEPESVKGTSQ